jgi:hypothetical protein
VLFIGNDWAEAHHDIEIVDEDGRRLARRRLPEGVDGLARAVSTILDRSSWLITLRRSPQSGSR